MQVRLTVIINELFLASLPRKRAWIWLAHAIIMIISLFWYRPMLYEFLTCHLFIIRQISKVLHLDWLQDDLIIVHLVELHSLLRTGTYLGPRIPVGPVVVSSCLHNRCQLRILMRQRLLSIFYAIIETNGLLAWIHIQLLLVKEFTLRKCRWFFPCVQKDVWLKHWSAICWFVVELAGISGTYMDNLLSVFEILMLICFRSLVIELFIMELIVIWSDTCIFSVNALSI